MKPVIRPAEPLYLIYRPCGCCVGYIRLGPGVLPHKLIIEERRKGNHVIETDMLVPPRLKDCPHKTTGTQVALPGLEPLIGRVKKKR